MQAQLEPTRPVDEGYIGTVSGPAIGSLFVDFSVRLPFFLYGFGAGLAGVVAFFLLRHLRHRTEYRHTAATPPVGVGKALRSPAYCAALASNFAVGFAVYGVRVSVLPLFLLVVLQQPAKWIGIGLTVCALTQTLLLPKAGQLADRWGRKPTLVSGMILVLVSFMIIQLGHGLYAYIAGLAFMGLGAAFCTTSREAALALGELFITRETVATDTLAKRATSLMVLMLFSLISRFDMAPLYRAMSLITGGKAMSMHLSPYKDM